MYGLKIKLNGKTISDLKLDQSKSYIAGRKEDCDIVLAQEKSISREHFKISFDGEAWTVELLSKFGEIFYRGDKIESQRLAHGDLFQVKPYEFEFYQSVEEASKTTDQLEPQVLAADSEEKTYVGGSTQVPFIRFSKTGQDSEPLLQLADGNSWVAGRESSCEIFIDDQRVSRKQYEIKKSGSQYKIIDLESVNGTFVNGQRLASGESKVLRSGDSISVLEHVMYFELRDPYFNARVSSVDYEKVSRALVAPDSEDSTNEFSQNSGAVVNYEGQYPQSANGHDPYAITPHVGQGSYPMAPYDPNAYPNMYQPGNGPTSAFPAVDNSKQQKIRIALIAVIVIGGAFFYLENSKQDSAPQNSSQGQGNPNDPFNKLTKEQQTLIKQSLKLAENYYDSDNAEFSKTELIKIKDAFPDYEKSSLGKKIRDLDEKAEQKIYVRVRLAEEEARAKAKAEQEQEIVRVTEECKKKLNANTTVDEMNTCLSPVIGYDPQNTAIVALQEQVEKMEVDRKVQAEQRGIYEEKIRQLRQQYFKAEKVEKSGSLLAAIDEYKKVVNSSLPDPDSLKHKAQRNIAALKSGINSKTSVLVQKSQKLFEERKLKEAIQLMRQVRQINPVDEEVPEKIEFYVRELRKDMKVMWDESIIEENYGKIMSDENNTGAVSKWKKILELDIPDGEFYHKAVTKLKKYGVQ